ncbi:PREDICTED: uncharacterized protein LOC108759622 [Trachymyrmex cornetzi]|uniref:uncharacterized protein LOC108759622 n=1 Tax=Trachymyrmex cornetzi TaxID=471704 RepID=UPI00084F362C|nr:PREDICTED: uncharacterized protein LOC108759622 [Trachymyrmex cornetzi]
MCPSDSDSEDVSNDVPPEILKTAKEIAFNSLPKISKQKYTKEYNEFKIWRSTKNTTSFAEPILLVYFNKIAKKFASSTIWSKFSMLKATIKAYNNIDIGTYPQLIAFLKNNNAGYKPKKCSIFTTIDVSKFLDEAPDAEYLIMKALLVIGLSGACRREELANICMEDIQDHKSFVFITLPKTKNKTVRTFTAIHSEDRLPLY